MDRTIVNIAKSQIGFIDFIINPAYQAAHKVLPALEANLHNVEHNKIEWTALFDVYEERMNAEKEKNEGHVNLTSAW